jgi:hypothetical protein
LFCFLLFFSSLLLLLLFSRLQQRSALPPGHAPPVLGTRERLCPHRPCWEPENGRACSTRVGDQRVGWPSVTDPVRHPHGEPDRSKSESSCCSPFPVPNNLCPVEQSKQLTLLTHETSAPATTALPRQTHTTVLRRAPSQPWGCRAGLGQPSVTDPSFVTDGRT